MKKGKYFSEKKNNHQYSPELEECIVEACQYCIDNTFVEDNEDKKLHPIMMHGMIQSGKTRAFTGLIALAFDNGFDIVFILTKNSKALVQQTATRMKQEFKLFINNNEIVVKDVMNIGNGLSGYQLEKKLIIIAKKQQDNLDKLIQLIEKYSIPKNKRTIIIDDEADTTGIGYEKAKNKDTDDYDLRKIAGQVNNIRGTLDGCVFVQVTATPYALYLQPEFENMDKIEPIKPQKTVLVPPGEGYVGGRHYFIDSQQEDNCAQFLFQKVSPEEHEIVSIIKRKGKKSKINDRRSFKEENILVNKNTLPVFKRGIINFFVGAIVLREKSNKHCSFVIHTATQKNSHESLKSVADSFLSGIMARDEITEPIIEKLLEDSYEDIRQSVVAYDFDMPTFNVVRTKFYEAIDKEHYRVDVVNSDNEVDNLLNEENGELNLENPFSIFVGGQILDRGITIANLIGFYYGRNPVTMQQDTVLQHSRMFGYRSKELLSVTRFYTTERLHSNMAKITEIDNELREEIGRKNLGHGVYFISQKKQDDKFGSSGKIVPCSPSKIKVSDVIFLKPLSRIMPIGFTPCDKTTALKIDNKIKRHLESNGITFDFDGRKLAIEDIEQILIWIYDVIKSDEESPRFIDRDEIITTLRYLAQGNTQIPVIIRLDRTISKYRKSGNNTVLSDSPDSPDPLKLARRMAIDLPVVMLIQETGKCGYDGWKGRPFWWPIIIAPKNIQKTMYALKTPSKELQINKPCEKIDENQKTYMASI